MNTAYQIGIPSREDLQLKAFKVQDRTTLKSGDADIECLGLNELVPQPRFSAEKYCSLLRSRTLGQNLLVAACIPSTQTLLHQHFTKLPDGVLCVADTQTSGKGRGSNTWTSPVGCLMFSAYTCLNISGQSLPFVQYVVSLAVVHAIQRTCKPLTEEASLDVRIKWPNDIYANKLKIGGILCQSVYRNGAFHVIIGAGLNVNNREPTTCLAALVAGRAKEDLSAQVEISREELLAHIAGVLEEYLQVLKEEGFGPLKQLYLNSWLHSGQKVLLEEQGGPGVPLTINGISDTGYLTANDERGESFELHPDGNSLDFFAGLVRHKMIPKEP